METLNIEKLQQELQKLGHERLDPNDPLFMDHLTRRLELQWHHEKINELLTKQQQEINTSNTAFSESLRKAYSEWINEGGEHLKACIDTAGNNFLEKLSLSRPVEIKQLFPFVPYAVGFSLLVAFSLGMLLGWKFL
ncbi:MAG: hypothetical protein VKJ04_05240 [Vampirovibrionales bacterium]|nr:hypothetical protein [Vampirovibrionales bacterium]